MTAHAPVHVGSRSLLDLFADTVRRHGDQPAVSGTDVELSYRHLARLSDRVAGRLRALGVRRGDRVALVLGRGPRVFVAVLGVLKAGAAYVPIDAGYPDLRRDLMVSVSGASMLVTDVAQAHRVPIGIRTVLIDELAGNGEVDDVLADTAGGALTGTDLAAVLFTSGSSGTPKAVALEHGNLVHFARNPALPELCPADRVGHVSNLSFDAFHFEMWSSLAFGATIVVLPVMPELVNGDVRRELRRQRITALLVPTMALSHVVREDRDAFESLRILYTGGDVLTPNVAREFLVGSFTGLFYNLYGPTEATTAVTIHPVTSSTPDTESVPIGTPIDGAAVYLLDSNLNRVGTGETGEIHIGGPGVARGYLGRPDLTADRFRPDPFVGGGARMYATADLGVRHADGILRFVGRIDDQVKIRGYRVEPQEVEQVLGAQPDVRDIAVVVAGGSENRHLVAVVVPYDEVSLRELRDFAQQRLPEFMVPGLFVVVDEIPADDHGKRDRSRLARLVAEHTSRAAARVPPLDRFEQRLVEIWEEFLAVETIGTTDNFFALGGNSLLAVQLRRRINAEFHANIKAVDVLVARDLRSLAAVIRDRAEVVRE